MSKVFVSTVPFGQADPRVLEMLRSAGAEIVINPLGRRLTAEELAGYVVDADVLVAGTEPITSQAILGSSRLKLIARVGIGLDNVDLAAARQAGISVCYTPDGPAPAVAELTIGLMIDLLRHAHKCDRAMRQGKWVRQMGRRLSTSTIGIVGVGRIGRNVIRHLAGGFSGVRILANDLMPNPAFGDQYGVTWVDKETLWRECDLVTLHLPLTPETKGLIGDEQLAMFKSDAILINTARGGIIDEAVLYRALSTGRIGAAAIDTFCEEPYAGPLTELENCLVTCHIGSMSQDCRAVMELEAVSDAVRFLRGEPLQGIVPVSEYPTP